MIPEMYQIIENEGEIIDSIADKKNDCNCGKAFLI
jgi:hypothetical protein